MIIGTKYSGYSRDNRRLYPMDSGPAPAASPSSVTQTQDLPDWAIPYAQNVLGKGEALSNTPYQAYTGERIAPASTLQTQAFTSAGAMQPSATTGAATEQALNTSYDPYATGQFNAQTSQQYMDPYMQNVVNIQQREAQRQADITGTQRNAQAVQAGAFGGSRQAIMDAEAARNLATQKGDIQAQGLQSAYSRGQTQFNTEQQLAEQSKQYGAGLGLQGLQTALTGANQEFQQGVDVNKLQQTAGATQQAQTQAGLSQQYQDFLDQKRAPYQQLEFQSNLLRGTPSGSASSLYTAAPSTTATLAGLGTAAYGLSKLAKGGKVKAKKQRPAGLAELAISRMA